MYFPLIDSRISSIISKFGQSRNCLCCFQSNLKLIHMIWCKIMTQNRAIGKLIWCLNPQSIFVGKLKIVQIFELHSTAWLQSARQNCGRGKLYRRTDRTNISLNLIFGNIKWLHIGHCRIEKIIYKFITKNISSLFRLCSSEATIVGVNINDTLYLYNAESTKYSF